MHPLAPRLRTWSHSPTAAPASDLMDEAALELERLTLTAAERAALRSSIADDLADKNLPRAAVLLALLARAP